MKDAGVKFHPNQYAFNTFVPFLAIELLILIIEEYGMKKAAWQDSDNAMKGWIEYFC